MVEVVVDLHLALKTEEQVVQVVVGHTLVMVMEEQEIHLLLVHLKEIMVVMVLEQDLPLMVLVEAVELRLLEQMVHQVLVEMVVMEQQQILQEALLQEAAAVVDLVTITQVHFLQVEQAVVVEAKDLLEMLQLEQQIQVAVEAVPLDLVVEAAVEPVVMVALVW